MRIIFIVLSAFLLGSFSLKAQTVSDVQLESSYLLGKLIYKSIPDHRPEAGKITLSIEVDRYGKVLNPAIIDSLSTIKNARQREETINAAKYCAFGFSDIDASETNKGTLTYKFFQYTSVQLDSIQIKYLDELKTRVQRLERMESAQRFTLYPTDNMWNFIELDTVSGAVYKVQFSTKGSEYRFKSIVSSEDLRKSSFYSDDEVIPGRFELYKTQNMYNFILIDKLDGRAWQVQWSMDGNDGILRIY